MGNEYYGVATTPTTDYLAHYGIKGMKWGVRKALSVKNGVARTRALGRQYKKAQKKLAKLERRAASGSKYAKRAAALGAGAAVAGGLAAAGTRGVGIGVANLSAHAARASRGAGKVVSGAGQAIGNLANVIPGKQLGLAKAAGKVGALGTKLTNAGAIGKNAGGIVRRGADVSKQIIDWGNQTSALGKSASLYARKGNHALGVRNPLYGVTKGTVARVGAGAAGLGLAGAAGYNAYRAATTKKAAAKAAQFRKEMNKAFAGTQYANAPRTPQKKRRRG